MIQYTCNSCALSFSSSFDQREHMKSDWHRYNLKRRVSQLPPITEKTFNEKVQLMSQNNDQATGSEKRQVTKKEIRNREKKALFEKKKKLMELSNENNSDIDMLKGSKQNLEVTSSSDHKNHTLTQNDETSIVEKLIEEKISNKVDIPLETCLFCPKSTFLTFEDNLDHMFKNHGFYIPEQKYLIDKMGLVRYLSEKIGLGNICLVCSYQGKTLEAVRAHMLSKSHCRIPYETESEKLEISEFYDFSSTYNELDSSLNDKEDQWVDIDDEDVSSENDDELSQQSLYHDGIELHLPTGIKVGHRSLQRYYKQNLRPDTILTEGQGTVIASDTRHLSSLFNTSVSLAQKKAWQTEVKDKKRHDKRSAKFINNQPHYRDQLLQ